MCPARLAKSPRRVLMRSAAGNGGASRVAAGMPPSYVFAAINPARRRICAERVRGLPLSREWPRDIRRPHRNWTPPFRSRDEGNQQCLRHPALDSPTPPPRLRPRPRPSRQRRS